MKWISTLNNNDLESMKQLVTQAEKDKRDKIIFQASVYEISYIKSVITVLEDNVIPDNLMDLELNN